MSQVVLMGNVNLTTPALHALLRREVPVSWHSYGGWFLGHTSGTGHKNVELRTAQYRASFDPAFCLRLARGLVDAKIVNARTLIRRNARKAVVAAYERRLDQEITHPVFGYRVSYRRLLEVQARLLGRHLMGEIPDLPAITPR